MTFVAQKAAFNNLLEQIYTDVQNDDRDPLDVYTVIDEIEKKITYLKKSLKEKAIDKAADMGEKKFDWKNYTVELRNGAARYDFKGIPEIEEAQKALKNTQDFFKSGLDSMLKGTISKENIKSEIINGEERFFFKTGENWFLSPLKKYSENSIIIKNKNNGKSKQ